MKISSSLQKCSFSLQAPLHCSNCRGSSLIRMSSLAARVGAAEAQVQALRSQLRQRQEDQQMMQPPPSLPPPSLPPLSLPPPQLQQEPRPQQQHQHPMSGSSHPLESKRDTMRVDASLLDVGGTLYSNMPPSEIIHVSVQPRRDNPTVAHASAALPAAIPAPTASHVAGGMLQCNVPNLLLPELNYLPDQSHRITDSGQLSSSGSRNGGGVATEGSAALLRVSSTEKVEGKNGNAVLSSDLSMNVAAKAADAATTAAAVQVSLYLCDAISAAQAPPALAMAVHVTQKAVAEANLAALPQPASRASLSSHQHINHHINQQPFTPAALLSPSPHAVQSQPSPSAAASSAHAMAPRVSPPNSHIDDAAGVGTGLLHAGDVPTQLHLQAAASPQPVRASSGTAAPLPPQVTQPLIPAAHAFFFFFAVALLASSTKSERLASLRAKVSPAIAASGSSVVGAGDEAAGESKAFEGQHGSSYPPVTNDHSTGGHHDANHDTNSRRVSHPTVSASVTSVPSESAKMHVPMRHARAAVLCTSASPSDTALRCDV